MNIIERSIQIALESHNGQFDLGGNTYILHPLRVMNSVEFATRGWQNQFERICSICVAVLHDTVEDAKYPGVISREIFKTTNDRISTIIFVLTRQEKESWKSYIERIEFDKLATLVKIYDLKDNLDNTRLKEITNKDEKRNKMYYKALKKLEKVYKEF